jgi:hypothetical protein
MKVQILMSRIQTLGTSAPNPITYASVGPSIEIVGKPPALIVNLANLHKSSPLVWQLFARCFCIPSPHARLNSVLKWPGIDEAQTREGGIYTLTWPRQMSPPALVDFGSSLFVLTFQPS